MNISHEDEGHGFANDGVGGTSQFDDAEEETDENGIGITADNNHDESNQNNNHDNNNNNNNNDENDDSSSCGFNDDDPRLQELFTTEPYPRPSEEAAKEEEEDLIAAADENVVMQCFEWTVQQHLVENEDQLGFWVSPNNEEQQSYSYNHEEEGKWNTRILQESSQWRPEPLPLPAWAVSAESGETSNK
mmetsp:Transcript_5746/g.7551  ORF Transcript_5746/g.7551 Transcript_5746/m.7551 type:complete len:189 (+) Transcript_5746:160-726(+)